MDAPRSHNDILLTTWDKQHHVLGHDEPVTIGGVTLDLGSIVAVARYGKPTTLSPSIVRPVEASLRFLEASLEHGDCIYGVNTGFGGSADTRTNDLKHLQRTVIRQLHYGIISYSPDPSATSTSTSTSTTTTTSNGGAALASVNGGQHRSLAASRRPLRNEEPLHSTTMPEAWVRSSTLVRINSLALGHSAVSLGLIQDLNRLLTDEVTPLIPLRGSISASGDLSPLSYLAGVLQGNPNVKARVRGHDGQQHIVSADQALHMMQMPARDFGPKEGLAIVNGTSVSAGVAALAMYDAHHLALLSQILTAMGVEAMGGTTESFDQFMADTRPHPGQLESCRNIRHFLDGSRLVITQHSAEAGMLRQDRYAIRTSTQWIGPQLEDLMLAHQQLTIEYNSATDNPLVQSGVKVLHGGNFQAQAVTSAVEKIRLCLQKLGRMLFAQSAELVNPSLNNGLPPNLVADEPSRSFLMKSVDLGTAAYASELGFLANPVGTHVMTAELGNQSINSLALVSARYTHTACDVLSQLSAAYLYALCQALDLRALNAQYLVSFQPVFDQILAKCFRDYITNNVALNTLAAKLWTEFQKEWNKSTSMDSSQRFPHLFNLLKLTLLDFYSYANEPGILHAMKPWTEQAAKAALELFLTTREQYALHPDATPFLGKASKRIYSFVRHELRVPFLKRDFRTASGHTVPVGLFEEFPGYQGSTGTMTSTIYDSFREGTIYAVAIDCLREAMQDEDTHMVRTYSASTNKSTSPPASKKRVYER